MTDAELNALFLLAAIAASIAVTVVIILDNRQAARDELRRAAALKAFFENYGRRDQP